jgi:hypothetical protein
VGTAARHHQPATIDHRRMTPVSTSRGEVQGRLWLGLAGRPAGGASAGPRLVHPSRCKAIASARLKNDKVDARTLAQLLRPTSPCTPHP